VVAYHIGLPFHGGFVGVDSFFVISGFVITGMLERELSETGRISLRQFYLKRFKRLIPALALVVSVIVLLSLMLLPPYGAQQTVAKTSIGAMSFVANWRIAITTGGYFDASADSNPLLHMWSLSVEEQFYLVFPALLVAGWMIGKRRKRWMYLPHITILFFICVSFFLAINPLGTVHSGKGSWLFGFYSPLTRAWEFGAGALLALTIRRFNKLKRIYLEITGILGVGLLVASQLLISEKTITPGYLTLLPVFSVLLLLIAGTKQNAFTTRITSWKPLVRIGDWSYSIYLWHWPFIVFATRLWSNSVLINSIAFLASLIPALLSYHWVESPLRKFVTSTKKGFARLLAPTLLVPITLAILLLTGTRIGFGHSQIQRLQQSVSEPFLGYASGCFNEGYFTSIAKSPDLCVWNGDAIGKPIYLVGDSQADQFSYGFVGAGKSLRRPVYSFTKAACPFNDFYFENPLIPDKPTKKLSMKSCRAYYDATSKWLTKQSAGTVVIGASDFYWTYPGISAVAAGNGGLSDNPTWVSAQLQAGLHSAITHLEQAGHRVVVIIPIPGFYHPYDWELKSCSTFSILTNHCKTAMPLEFALERQTIARLGIEAAIVGTSATTINLNQVLCPSKVCGTNSNIVWTVDGTHVSTTTSRFLTPYLIRALTSVAI
jgi:peptidoglycan/LPS O-acetylase OafA/YrhL